MQWQLYYFLLGFDRIHKAIFLLAESYEPNATATVFTVRLKPGVEFNNGNNWLQRTTRAGMDQRILNPKTAAAGTDLLTD